MKSHPSALLQGFFPASVAIPMATFFAIPSSLPASILITESGTYMQNFDSLPSSGSTNTVHTWENDTTLPGWFAEGQAVGGALTEIRTGPHTSNGGSIYFYSYGSPTNDSDRAIGFVQTNTNNTNNFALGLLFENQSGSSVTFDTFSFWGEQYRYSGAGANTNTAWYQISSTEITSPSYASSDGWTALPSLDLTTPVYSGNNPDGLSASTVTNGNLDNNRTFVTADISSITLQNGEYIMFRFFDLDYGGTDHALGYDDVSVNWSVAAVPESSAMVIISSLLSIAMAVSFRRRSHR